MSAKGLPATTIRSASLPGSTVPSSGPTPHISAAFLVAAVSACQAKPFSSNRGPYLTQAMLYSDSHETMDLAFIKNRKETDA